MKTIKLIPAHQRKGKICSICDSDKSVKYFDEKRKKHFCNKCILMTGLLVANRKDVTRKDGCI